MESVGKQQGEDTEQSYSPYSPRRLVPGCCMGIDRMLFAHLSAGVNNVSACWFAWSPRLTTSNLMNPSLLTCEVFFKIKLHIFLDTLIEKIFFLDNKNE